MRPVAESLEQFPRWIKLDRSPRVQSEYHPSRRRRHTIAGWLCVELPGPWSSCWLEHSSASLILIASFRHNTRIMELVYYAHRLELVAVVVLALAVSYP